MPKSKRSREVALTQTDKRATREHKSAFIQQVRDSLDQFDSLYLFSYENMRSSKFKDMRMHFRGSDMEEPSKILLGKNKLLQIALGRTPEEEYSDNLRHVAKRIKGGSVGLLLTNKSKNEIEKYFHAYCEPDFARAGATAIRQVVVELVDLDKFPVSMMEQLRKLGMPVEIKQGKVVLRDGQSKYVICKEGQTLSAEQSKLLVHFGVKVSEFRISLVCRWSNSEFEELQ